MSVSEAINHNTLVHLVEAGAIDSAMVIANDDKWQLNVLVAGKTKTIIAKNSKSPRIWRKLDTLAKYLKDLGLHSFTINVADYNPEKKTLRRPDSAATLKRTHQAHRSLQKNTADNLLTTNKIKKDNSVSPEKVREKWEKRRARILAEENPRVK